MTRSHTPKLFSLTCCLELEAPEPGIHLRWMVAPGLGLPRAHFVVWTRDRAAAVDRQLAGASPLRARTVVDWGGQRQAFVAVELTVPAGKPPVTVRGYSLVDGGGQVLDERTAGSGRVVLSASGIGSVVIVGEAAVVGVRGTSMQALLDAPEWKPYERVGLPVDGTWSGYPSAPQGLVTVPTSPTLAALARMRRGRPRAGWASADPRGRPIPAWRAPHEAGFVEELQRTLLPAVKQMLSRPDPAPALDIEWSCAYERGVTAPTSAHGETMRGPSSVSIRPLGTLLALAGTDSSSALALGFGTFVPLSALGVSEGAFWHSPSSLSSSVSHEALRLLRSRDGLPLFAGRVMVTLDCDLTMDLSTFFPGLTSRFVVNTTLADVVTRFVEPPSAPRGLQVRACTLGRAGDERPFLDRPKACDEPFLGSVDVMWNRELPPSARAPNAGTSASFAIARAIGAENMKLLLEPMRSGGHRPFVATAGVAPDVHYIDRAVPEPRADESPDATYSVAGCDLFGRWTSWVSADYARPTVRPQAPTVLRVALLPASSRAEGEPARFSRSALVQDAVVEVDLAWNWADRSPDTLELQLVVEPEDAAPTAHAHTVRSIGGSEEPNVTLVRGLSAIVNGTSRADAQLSPLPDAPPQPDMRYYRASVAGFRLDFSKADRIRVTARARATESFRPAPPAPAAFRPELWSAWSPAKRDTTPSPVPPLAPAALPGITWAGLPDAGGVARVHLHWTSAPGQSYVIYTADESTVRRELGLPAPDLRTPVHRRLREELRGHHGTGLRRAFQRVAEGIIGGAHEIALPKGTRLVHFFVVVAVSATGVESEFPQSSDQWTASAGPHVATPEAPVLSARAAPNGIRIDLRLPRGGSAPARIELYRTRREANAFDVDDFGPPLAATPLAAAVGHGWSVEPPSDGEQRLHFLDAGAPATWEPLWYRALVWSASDHETGALAARSAASPARVAVRPDPEPPRLTQVGFIRSGSTLRVSWVCSLPRARTSAGVASYRVTATAGANVIMRRATADQLRLFSELPTTPAQAPDIFVYRPSAAAPPSRAVITSLMEVPAGPVAVVVEAIDPAGRITTHMEVVP